ARAASRRRNRFTKRGRDRVSEKLLHAGGPGVHPLFQHGQGHGAAGQDFIVKSAQVEFLTQLLFVAGA
nr:hypothetical protein [Tanacetum cinerariifolium]